MATDKDVMDALDKIDAELTTLETKGITPGEIAAYCTTYHLIKKPMEILLEVIEKIPIIGKKVAYAVRFLMKIVDIVCPV